MPDIGPLLVAAALYMAVTAMFITTAVGRLRTLAQRHFQQQGLSADTARPSHGLSLVLRASGDAELEALRRRAIRPIMALALIEATFLATVLLLVLRGGFE